jgi:hypothetical protein
VLNRFAIIALVAAAPLAAQAPTAAQPAAKGPQPITKALYTGEIDKGFNVVDTNKDGFIDRTEMSANDAKVVAAAKAQMLRQSEAAFKQLDKDNNGSLSTAEFNAIALARDVRAEDPAKSIAAFDTNKDGKISLAESRAPRLAQFDRADTNKDGSLSVAEQQAAQQQAAQRRR